MKVANYTLALSALLLVSASSNAFAGPQSMLDPYSNIKAPTKKVEPKQPAPKKVKPIATEASVTIGAPVTKSASSPISSGDNSAGFLEGTKQIFHGFGTATKGAAADVMKPGKAIAGGVVGGGKKIKEGIAGSGGAVVKGAKNAGSFVAKGAKNSTDFVAKGTKGAGEKIKDGTQAVGHTLAIVPKKMGEGLKATGEKVKEGSEAAGKAIAVVPKTVGKGVKSTGEKVVGGTQSAGSKIASVPKAIGKGIAGAAGKTGEATKKVATAPIALVSKLNPFKHHDAPAIETAAKGTGTH